MLRWALAFLVVALVAGVFWVRGDRGSQCGRRENLVFSLFDLVPGLSYRPFPATHVTGRDQKYSSQMEQIFR